jgi:hypothetical protein
MSARRPALASSLIKSRKENWLIRLFIRSAARAGASPKNFATPARVSFLREMKLSKRHEHSSAHLEILGLGENQYLSKHSCSWLLLLPLKHFRVSRPCQMNGCLRRASGPLGSS